MFVTTGIDEPRRGRDLVDPTVVKDANSRLLQCSFKTRVVGSNVELLLPAPVFF
jgi:hypothetical protein